MQQSMVSIAAEEFARGNYSEALNIYRKLSSQMGEHVFHANIHLCIKRRGKLVLPKQVELNCDANSTVLELGDDPVWLDFELSDTDYAELYGEVHYLNTPLDQFRRVVLLVEYLDPNGNVLPGPYKDLSKSDALGWFSYLAPSAGFVKPLAVLQPCAGATHVRLGFRSFFKKDGECLSIGRRLNFLWLDNQENFSSQSVTANPALPSLPCLPFEMPQRKAPRRLKVASVLDAFSHACFAPEADLISVTPSEWRRQLLGRKIDFVLVESAWHGNGDAWLYRVASYAKPPGNEIGDLVRWARKYGIPTVFWNKEDPPNFDRFIERAKDFDFIFTTDENCVERYRQRVRSDAHVAALPFAAQPRIHNSLLQEARLDKTMFAGSYYTDDFEPRRRAMDMLLSAATRYGLDIFDRMFNATGKDKERHTFPKGLQPYIQGSLAYDEMLKAYRHYRVALNVNSVSDSPTMFSRRVFELLACGTPVVSTESLGIDRIFKGLVPTVESEGEASLVLEELMTDAAAWLRASVRGLRAVYSEHTYGHRMCEIAQAVGVSDYKLERPEVLVAVRPDGNAARFASFMAEQTDRPLVVIVQGTPQRDPAVQQHLDALLAVGLKAFALPVGNIASYARERHPLSLVAVCSSSHHYGPTYLRDARISLDGLAEVDASTMESWSVGRKSLSDLSFADVACIGMTTSRAHGGTVVTSSHSLVLPIALARAGDDAFEIRGHWLRTRASFEFAAHIDTQPFAHSVQINLK